MQRILAAVLAAAAVAVTPAVGRSMMIAPQPVAQRVAVSDVVVVGKIVRLEDRPVMARAFPTAPMPAEYRIAVLRVDEGIAGVPQGTKEIRIGFQPPPPPLPPPPPGGPIAIGPKFRGVTFEPGQEVLVFLTPHFEGGFQTAPAYFSVVNKAAPTYEKDLAEARRCAKLLEVPNVGLTAKSEEERFLTAAMLIARYRSQRPSAKAVKEEAIDAAQSQRILDILAEAEWSAPGRQGFYLSPAALFNMIGPKEGFKQPMDAKLFEAEAKKWLKANAGTYVIKRFVEVEKP